MSTSISASKGPNSAALPNSNNNPNTNSNLLSTPSALLTTLLSFLRVYIHHLLYLRRLYPTRSFLSTRAYNYPVRQSRHPAVCQWINSAISAIEMQLLKGGTAGGVERISVAIFGADDLVVVERFVIGLRSWGGWGGGREVGLVEFERQKGKGHGGEGGENPDSGRDQDQDIGTPVNVTDLEAQFRATLSRLSSTCSKLAPLPHQRDHEGSEAYEGQEYTFTVTMELKDEADKPVGILDREERQWVAAETDQWNDSDDESQEVFDAADDEDMYGSGDNRRRKKRRRVGGKSMPVRRLDAGELRMELWVEESKEKFKDM